MVNLTISRQLGLPSHVRDQRQPRSADTRVNATMCRVDSTANLFCGSKYYDQIVTQTLSTPPNARLYSY